MAELTAVPRKGRLVERIQLQALAVFGRGLRKDRAVGSDEEEGRPLEGCQEQICLVPSAAK